MIINRIFIFLGVVTFLFFQIAEISRFPLLNEDLSMINSNFSAEPFLDQYFYKMNQPLDVSFANQLPFQLINILCNKLGIYGYDVYLVKYAFNLLVIIFLLIYLYSRTINLNYYLGVFATLCVVTTLIFDQVMLYTPRISALIIICCIFLYNYKYLDSLQESKYLKIILYTLIFIYSFGLFSNIGNAFTVLTPFIYFLYLKFRDRQEVTWKKLCEPYTLLIPSFFMSTFLVWNQARNFNTGFQDLTFFQTTSASELIQGRGAWWEKSYLPWSSSLDNSLLMSFRFVLFSIILISFSISLISSFTKKKFGPKKRIPRGNDFLIIYGILFFLTLSFPSKQLTEFISIFYIFREPWSKFGPIMVLFYGYSISISMKNLFSFVSKYFTSHLNRILINVFYSLILFAAVVIMVPDRTPKSRFSSDIDFAVTYDYAKYISKSTLKVNSMLSSGDTVYIFCLIPSGDYYSDLTAGRWFFAFSKNIKHNVELKEKITKLGANPYAQLGIIVNYCSSIGENSQEVANYVRICLPNAYQSPLRKCDFTIRGIPRFVF